VTLTAPADGSSLTGTTTVSAQANDDVGVAGVQFLLDGAALGAERTTAPYSYVWNTATTANGTHTLAAVARDAAGNHTQSASVTLTVSNTSQILPGLVAAYGFNEGAGVQVADASGNGNVGTISSATWAAGKYGSSLLFNGTSAWVTVADSPTLHLTTGLTVEAWVNPTSGAGWREVVLKEASNTLSYALYAENNASKPAGYIHTTTDVAATGTTALVLNSWSHVALTYDGSAMRLFVNGIQVKSTSVTGSALVSNGALRIGGNAIWGEYFKGSIDEVRIYNRALNGAEIQQDMSTPIQ
jgi:hypothetical protein